MTTLVCSAMILSAGDSPFAGLYTGVNVGINTAEAQVSSSAKLFIDAPLRFVEFEGDERLCRRAAVVDLFVGYGRMQCGEYYLGMRGGLSLAERRVRQDRRVTANDNLTVIIHPPDHATLSYIEPFFDFKGGWLICDDLMLYALLGASSTRLKASGFPVETADGLVLQPLRLSNHRVGYRFGGGMEYQLGCRYGLNLTYVYTLYSRLTHSDNPTGGIPRSIRVHPSTQATSVGLTYYY